MKVCEFNFAHIFWYDQNSSFKNIVLR